MASTSPHGRDLVTYRKARHEYHILDTVECGLALRGTEVKSLREGKASLAQCFGEVTNREAFVVGLRIEPYTHGNINNHDPLRAKKLLLHRWEIERIAAQSAAKGYTLIPLRDSSQGGRIQLELALCKGKSFHDKRETLKRRTAESEARRAIEDHTRR